MKRVLLIEDEKSVSSFIEKGLKENNYTVHVAEDGATGISLLLKFDFTLIILDVILPDIDGFKVCEKIRSIASIDTPILMLTALGTTENIVKGLNLGADDYLVKPFKFQELLARLNALQRRVHKQISNTKTVITVSDLSLNLDTKTAFRNKKEIILTSTEYRLLEYLLKNKNKVLSRIDLLENVWDINFDIGTNVVDVYVNYLRKKIDKDYKHKLIHTVVGMGYILKERNED